MTTTTSPQGMSAQHMVRTRIALSVADEIAQWLADDPSALVEHIASAARYDLAGDDAQATAHNLRNDLLRRIAQRLAKNA